MRQAYDFICNKFDYGDRIYIIGFFCGSFMHINAPPPLAWGFGRPGFLTQPLANVLHAVSRHSWRFHSDPFAKGRTSVTILSRSTPPMYNSPQSMDDDHQIPRDINVLNEQWQARLLGRKYVEHENDGFEDLKVYHHNPISTRRVNCKWLVLIRCSALAVSTPIQVIRGNHQAYCVLLRMQLFPYILWYIWQEERLDIDLLSA